MSVHLPADRDADAWQLAIWNADDKFLSGPQKLQFMLMIAARFNAFDPFRVVGDLIAHRDLWQGAVMQRGFPWEEPKVPTILGLHIHSDLIALRDIGRGYWNVDTLYLLTAVKHQPALDALAACWSADERSFLDGDGVGKLLGSMGGGPETRRITRVWWD